MGRPSWTASSKSPATCNQPLHACEALERRALLAGVTILTHGFNSAATEGTWADRMGDAIADRLGGHGAVSQYTLAVTGSSSQPTAYALTNDPGTPAWGETGDASNPRGEILIKLDWSQISTSFGISADEVGGFVGNALLGATPGGRSLLEVPIHLIGHSRGASLMAQLAKTLGQAGLWIEQLTTLDPHPSSFFNDAAIQVWQNIVHADNYWRGANSNPFDFPGQSINGADNNGPLALPGGSSLDHSDVHAYYHGTVDRDATSNGAGGPVVDSWYGGNANRATTGFNSSRIGRGSILAGIGTNFGGASARAALTITSPQWYSNVGFLGVTGDTNGAFASGDDVTVNCRYQAAHASLPTTVSFYIDGNTNPYDAGAIALGSQTVAPAGSNNPTSSFNFTWPSLAGGLYRVYAKITNPDGFSRYAYNNQPLVVTAGGGVEIITKQWTGDVSSNWSDPRNWTPGGVTAGTDRAAIQIPSTAHADLAGAANARAIHVLSGGLIANGDASGVSLNIGPSAYAVLNATQHLSSLNMSGGAATLSAGGNKVLIVESLSIGPAATLDLTDNDLIIDYSGSSPVGDVEADVASAYNVVGNWLGNGITSSDAAADGNFVVAVADNAQLASPFGSAQGGPVFAGVEVDLTAVLVKFTHRADVDLDGKVTPNDAAIFGGNYSEGDPAFWAIGDMDYDGLFTPTDAAIFGGFYDESLPQL